MEVSSGDDSDQEQLAFEWKSVVKRTNEKRKNLAFHEIAELIKSRVSFYMIFELADKIDLITKEFYHLRQ